MTLEALPSNDLLNIPMDNIVSATPFATNLENNMVNRAMIHQDQVAALDFPAEYRGKEGGQVEHRQELAVAVRGRKRRRRKPRVCKNKEEAETQRMTHIAVERNRRKQMNEHLAALRSLMPESYAQRGDQASIVGGAIEFIKELEHLLQSLEAQKLQLQQGNPNEPTIPPFSQFFLHPQYSSTSRFSTRTSANAAVADMDVTLIETHANVRILSRRRKSSPTTQLYRMVAALNTLSLSVLHLNVTTMEPLVLYSISVKVEEGCQLTSVDDIAGAVNHVLEITEEEAMWCSLCTSLPELPFDLP